MDEEFLHRIEQMQKFLYDDQTKINEKTKHKEELSDQLELEKKIKMVLDYNVSLIQKDLSAVKFNIQQRQDDLRSITKVMELKELELQFLRKEICILATSEAFLSNQIEKVHQKLEARKVQWNEFLEQMYPTEFLGSQKTRCENMQAELDKQNSAVAALEARESQLNEEKAQLELQNTHLQAKIKDLSKRIPILEQEFIGTKAFVDHNVAELHKEEAEAEDMLNVLLKQNRQLAMHVENLEKKLLWEAADYSSQKRKRISFVF